MDGDHRRGITIGSLVFTGILWLLSGYIAFGALSFSFEARIAPLLFGGIGFVFLTYLLIRDVMRIRVPQIVATETGEGAGRRVEEQPDEGPVVDEVIAVGWVLGVVVVLLALGFVVGMTLAILAIVRIYARERMVIGLALTVGVMAVLYFVFGQILNTPLYPGLLGMLG